ncbi:hypothetical protein M8J77_011241 [Diaphorina citri]|nr:hypothetical protein M8J77_011241 [Diaphorina citri]
MNMNMPLFNGEGFNSWKFRMENLLSEQGVLGAINSKDFTTVGTTAEIEKAVKLDCKAKNLIVQCVGDSQLNSLRNKTSAYEMWVTLVNNFEKKGLCGKLIVGKEKIILNQNEA